MSDIITNITPEATPFFSKCGKTTANNTLVEWQTDTLRNSAANAHIEGDATTAQAAVATVRLNNRTQIFKNAVIVSDTDEGLNKAGRQREMAYQIVKIAKEQKLDIEKALFDNNAKVAGNATTARELAGAPSWMTTNVNFVSGNSGANPTGDGTDARTDDGAPTAFSQTKFDAVMQSIWENGGKPDTVYLSAFQMNVALALLVTTTSVQMYRAVMSVLSKVSRYTRLRGVLLSLCPSRENRSRDVFIMQDDKWEVATLRPTKNTELAKTGDNTQRQIVTELTLCAKNEAANGIIADNTIIIKYR